MRLFARFAVICLASGSVFASEPAIAKLSYLRTTGLHIVNEDGQRVSLRGFNLGSWLLLEPWMIKLDGQEGVAAEKDIWDQLAERFGEERMRTVVAAYRENFITEADIETLRKLGVNFLRLPIWWRTVGDTAYDSDGWKYVDRLLDWCEARGIYVLLDLHGAPGGQSTGANILGERPDGTYWATNSSHRAQAVDWWRAVARRYAGRSVVAGYDLLNEAWAAPSVKVLMQHMDEMYRAIREIDRRHIIFIEDALQGYHRMPVPANMNWQNVVYSFHFYPDNAFTFTQRDLLGLRSAQLQYGVPIHIGEFNVYNGPRGGISGIDRILQVFNTHDWSWTLWSYKVLESDHDYFWGLTGLADGFLPGISLKKSGYEDILGYFRRTATTNWQTHALLRACLEQRLAPVSSSELPDTPPATLLPSDAMIIARDRDKGLRIEWQWVPANLGFWGPQDSAAWYVSVAKAGNYRLDLNHAAGGEEPVAELLVDGVAVAKTSLRSTGDWRNYQWASIPCGPLGAGRHVLRLTCGGGKDFLNLREARLVADKNAAATQDAARIELSPAEISAFQRKGHVCVEWQNTPPNIGCLNEGDAVVFRFNLPRAGDYIPTFEWSSPNSETHLRLEVNGKPADTVALEKTGDWHHYTRQLSDVPIKLPMGTNELVIRAVDVANESGAGNLRCLRLELAGQQRGSQF